MFWLREPNLYLDFAFALLSIIIGDDYGCAEIFKAVRNNVVDHFLV